MILICCRFKEGKLMNLVFARHSNDERVRLFRVCDGETLKHGQKIIVRTRRGDAKAIVSGDSFETTDGTANIIAMKCGSYYPPAEVIAREITVTRKEMACYVPDVPF